MRAQLLGEAGADGAPARVDWASPPSWVSEGREGRNDLQIY
jgi:hypothetical protein